MHAMYTVDALSFDMIMGHGHFFDTEYGTWVLSTFDIMM